ncbi:MAG TPA: hypothetical protein VHZ24_10180 [Pirellulales bacterium]|jgi:hypothetical protein|nr:hypothetical protein [Pirellulales bacterium]
MSAAFPTDPNNGWRRGDGPHPREPASIAAWDLPADWHLASDDDDDLGSASEALGVECPEAIARLEVLDDTVFEAIAGRPEALEALRRLWPEVLVELGPELIEPSLAQYIRHAMRLWQDCVEGDQIRNPALAVNVMEVIRVLLGE